MTGKHRQDRQGRSGDIDRGAGGMSSVTASHCSRFSRRSDMSIFNMADYTSCENCRHNTDTGECLVGNAPTQGSFY